MILFSYYNTLVFLFSYSLKLLSGLGFGAGVIFLHFTP